MVISLDGLRVGDEVLWKRHTVNGLYRCRIVGLRPGAKRPIVLQILYSERNPAYQWRPTNRRYVTPGSVRDVCIKQPKATI